jgi:VanZ family protein
VISTVLAEYPWLSRVLLIAVVAACTALGWMLLRPARRSRTVLRALAAVSLVAALALTLSPSSRYGEPVFCVVDAFWGARLGIEALANIALLIPLALFAGLATRRPLPVLAATTGLSAAIELVQALVPGLGRSCTTSDWMLNSLGALIGTVLCAGMLVLARHRGRLDRRPAPRE